MRDENYYLQQRESSWHYYRRVPSDVREVERREFVRMSLKTSSVVLARKRRDELIVADNDYWTALLTLASMKLSKEIRSQRLERIEQRYKLARSRARIADLGRPPLERLLAELAANPSLVDQIGFSNFLVGLQKQNLVYSLIRKSHTLIVRSAMHLNSIVTPSPPETRQISRPGRRNRGGGSKHGLLGK